MKCSAEWSAEVLHARTRVEFYKALYDDEWKRREVIDSAATLPSGILTVLGGALFYLATSFIYGTELLTYAFCAFLLSAIGSLACAVWCLAQMLLRHEYQHIPTGSELKQFDEELLAHYSEHRDELLSPGDPERDFQSHLSDRLAAAAHHNAERNKAKADYLHRTNTCVFAVLVFTALTALPAGLNIVRHRGDVGNDRLQTHAEYREAGAAETSNGQAAGIDTSEAQGSGEPSGETR